MTQTFEDKLLPVTKLPLVMLVQPFQYTGLQIAHLHEQCKNQCNPDPED